MDYTNKATEYSVWKMTEDEMSINRMVHSNMRNDRIGLFTNQKEALQFGFDSYKELVEINKDHLDNTVIEYKVDLTFNPIQ